LDRFYGVGVPHRDVTIYRLLLSRAYLANCWRIVAIIALCKAKLSTVLEGL